VEKTATAKQAVRARQMALSPQPIPSTSCPIPGPGLQRRVRPGRAQPNSARHFVCGQWISNDAINVRIPGHLRRKFEFQFITIERRRL
jgi:hypothetical protein